MSVRKCVDGTRRFGRCLTLKQPRITVYFMTTRVHMRVRIPVATSWRLLDDLNLSRRARSYEKANEKSYFLISSRARILSKKQSFTYSLWHFFFHLHVSGKLILHVIYEICVSRSARVEIYDLCTVNAVEAIVSKTRSSFYANECMHVRNINRSRRVLDSEMITINSSNECSNIHR